MAVRDHSPRQQEFSLKSYRMKPITKKSICLICLLLTGLWLCGETFGQRGGRGGGGRGGGGRGGGMSRPAGGGGRGGGMSRPTGGGMSRPAGGRSPSMSRPAPRPNPGMSRPATSRPSASRPSTGRPGPSTRPSPSRPSTGRPGPSTRPSPSRPSTGRPAPGTRPSPGTPLTRYTTHTRHTTNTRHTTRTGTAQLGQTCWWPSRPAAFAGPTERLFGSWWIRPTEHTSRWRSRWRLSAKSARPRHATHSRPTARWR